MNIYDQTLLEKLKQELYYSFYHNQNEFCCPEVIRKSEELDQLILKFMRRRNP